MTSISAAFITAEMTPYAKAGGLADVAGALPEALAGLDVQTTLLMPLYRDIEREQYQLEPVSELQELPVGAGRYGCSAALYRARGTLKGLDIYFIAQDKFFDRPGIYTDPDTGEAWPDDAARFFFFQEAALAALAALDVNPQLLHLNDYHTALIPLLLQERADFYNLTRETKTLLTLHNIGYQGIYPSDELETIGLSQGWLTPLTPLEYYGRMNVLKAGISYADHVNTVSPGYAEEILTPEQGYGLEGVLREMSHKVSGVLNGIDTAEWDPATDPHLVQSYSLQQPEGKEINKQALQKECGLTAGEKPLAGIVTRLVHQKGIDLLLEGVERMLATGLQLVILGSGERRYEEALQRVAVRHPEQMALITGFNNVLAHRIEAGSDLFLMPSRYEPCGLNQLYSLRYGTVPVVASTGGLRNTVQEWNSEQVTGTGFLFEQFTAEAMLAAIERAIELYQRPEQWRQITRNGMQEDHSWQHAALKYRDLYHNIVKGA